MDGFARLKEVLRKYMVVSRERTEDSREGGSKDESEEEEEILEDDSEDDEDGDGEKLGSSDDGSASEELGQDVRSRSRGAPSPTSSCASELAKQVASIDLEAADPPSVRPTDSVMGGPSPSTVEEKPVVRQLVASEVSRQQQKEKAKYHSKKGGAGRARGSKAKQDTRIKANAADGW